MRCRRLRSTTPSAAVWPPAWPWVASRVEAYDNARQERPFGARGVRRSTSGSIEKSLPQLVKVSHRERRGRRNEPHAASSRGPISQPSPLPPKGSAPAGLGLHLGSCLSRSIRRGVLCLRGLSHRLWVMDGPRPCALCGTVPRPPLCALSDQYSGFRRPRREHHIVPGLAPVRFLHAPPGVGQGPASHLRFALGAADGSRLPLIPLDADRRTGSCEWSARSIARHRWPNLVQSPRPRT